MKKIALLALLALMTGPLFGQSNKKVTSDDIESFIESYYKALMDEDAEALGSLLAEDGLFCGTDPSEYWDKQSVVEMFEQSFTGEAFDLSELVKKRVIHLSDNGMSAMVLEHINMPWSPNIPVRQTFHVTRNGSKWQIDFIGWSFIADNDDIARLNAAVAQ
jgi:hypothetical protein